MLNSFESASSQKINVEKSSIFFSKNTSQEIKTELCATLRFQEAGQNSTYPSLLNIMGRNKSVLLGYLKQRMHDRIQGWDKSFLSKGGKEILLKTVAQTLQNYVMNVFLLSMKLCKDMEHSMCKFWWKIKNRGIHWMSWERMSKKKSDGGLGFRNLHEFKCCFAWEARVEVNF